jgi:gamma-glutamyl AIG2-like cyclotransferase
MAGNDADASPGREPGRPMSSRRIQVFFYGLFMDAEVLRAKGAEPAHVRRAIVSGFALRIGQRATLVPDPDARVHGVVMELQPDEIDRIYAEPGVREYRPEAVIAELEDGSQLPVLCFNLPRAPRPDEKNEEYARRLSEVALRVGLPPSYVKSIG